MRTLADDQLSINICNLCWRKYVQTEDGVHLHGRTS